MSVRFLLVGTLLALGLASSAVAQNPRDEVARRVAAGEFGPARAVANRAGADRDRLLADIAAAQAASGAQKASLSSLADIVSDQTRSYAASQIASTPLGGAMGGAAQADFQPLIDLITATIAPQSWEDAGGPGAVEEFPGGVYVDTNGLLKRIKFEDGGRRLTAIRSDAIAATGNFNPRQKSTLRKVSLTRLERELQTRWAMGQPADEAMQMLAGMYRVQYVLVYPETGDIVLAGPAGNWERDVEGRVLNADTHQPVLRLDDLVVLLRNSFDRKWQGKFSCSIDPRRDNLAKTQAFLAESAKQPLKPGAQERANWLKKVRDTMGEQDISVEGLDPRTRVSRVIVEADYRMKLVGMGLEEGVLGVKSYLASVNKAGSMDVLRWWFTLNYDAVQATQDRRAFELKGQGVKVLSENELLGERGQRVHTGKSDELNQEFAHSFTKQFEALAAKYPIYMELRNVFDLALVTALLRSEDLPGQVDWHMTHFGDPTRFAVELGNAPATVETVINHRLIGGTQIVAGVSGGVSVDTSGFVKRDAIKVDTYGKIDANRTASLPKKSLSRDAWWWD